MAKIKFAVAHSYCQKILLMALILFVYPKGAFRE